MAQLSHCNPDHLREAVKGTLAAQPMRDLEQHLSSCRACQHSLDALAANENEWEKISDYFSVDDLWTEPYECQPTVDIQLNRSPDDPVSIASAPGNRSSGGLSETLQPASHPELLGRIDGFEIERIIGRGGMGVVYKGYDTELNRPVAIKVLVEHLAANGVARQRFAREARAAAAVIHPNVVPIHSVNSAAKQPYLVMTLVSGRSLQAHIEQQGALPVREIVRISKQIAAGLAAAHREGLVHRDIKPANILLEKDVSRVMITDFGLARAADDAAITQTGWLAGTPHYMSPEQANGREVDHRSDLFSLGSVMYFMATGREPFRAEIPVAILQKITNDSPHAVRSINSDATRTLQRIVERLMAKQPDERFQTAEEVERVLTQYLAHLEQPRTQPKPRIRRAKNRFAQRWLAGSAMLATVLAVTAWSTGLFNVPSAPETDTAWMAGLQSPESWQLELAEIQREISQLENQELELPRFQSTLEPTRIEFIEFENSIEQLERSLRD